MNNLAFSSKKYFLPLLCVVVLLLLAASPSFARSYTIILLNSTLMYIIFAVSWTIFSGSTGYVSLASAAFFGVGIYTVAILGRELPLFVVLAMAGIFAFCLALLVGGLTLRLRGIYFAIFTFGIVEFIKHVLLWWEINITGTRGRHVISEGHETVYYIMLGILIAALLLAFFIRRSKLGLALQAIGENEEAAVHIGINVTLVKVVTFAISAVFMGISGATMATRWSYVDPYIAFDPFFSFMPVLMSIFGGMGHLLGPVVGATIFAYLEEYLVTRYPYHYMLIFGFVMVVTILYLPSGLTGLLQKLRGRVTGGKICKYLKLKG